MTGVSIKQSDVQQRVRKVLKHHAPLDDAQICYLIRQLCGISESTVKKARRHLVDRGEVRFARLVRENRQGQLVHLWELAR